MAGTRLAQIPTRPTHIDVQVVLVGPTSGNSHSPCTYVGTAQVETILALPCVARKERKEDTRDCAEKKSRKGLKLLTE